MVGKVVKFLIVCLAVGFVLVALDLDPQSLLAKVGGVVEGIATIVISFFDWALKYILAGAVLVVPIYLLVLLYRYLRQRL